MNAARCSAGRGVADPRDLDDPDGLRFLLARREMLILSESTGSIVDQECTGDLRLPSSFLGC